MEQMPLIIFRFFVIKPLGSALEKGLLLFWWGLRALSDSEKVFCEETLSILGEKRIISKRVGRMIR